MDPYKILGVAASATDDEVKKAYRKLAQTHHPDKGGDEAKFKEIKAAFEQIEAKRKNPNAWQGVGSGDTDGSYENMDDFIRAFRAAASEHHRRNAVPNVHIRVSIADAFNGVKVPINVFGRSIAFALKPSMPDGVTFSDQVPVDDGTKQVLVTLHIDSGPYTFLGNHRHNFFSGDLEAVVELDAIDLILGCWMNTRDFLGRALQVRVPAGFDPNTRLKVAGHGYSNWVGDKAGNRGDLYLRVIPKFSPPSEISFDKAEMLYKAVLSEVQKTAVQPEDLPEGEQSEPPTA